MSRPFLLVFLILFSSLIDVDQDGIKAQTGFNDAIWTYELGIPIPTAWRAKNGTRVEHETVTADLFRPRAEGRLPAAVIINSSGGVTAHTELYYARLLAANGVVALAVDSFRPRGVVSTVQDQNGVWQSRHFADAAAAFRWLSGQPYVDPARIIVMGMSRGANAALTMAIEDDRRRLGATDIRFAGHIAVAPGCGQQQRDARSTGAPIFFALSELDDYTPIKPCLAYAQRLRDAGNAAIRLAVYPGVYHAQESTSGTQSIMAERSTDCEFYTDAEWNLYDRRLNRSVPSGQERAYHLRTCLDKGPVTVGGDARVKGQLAADLLQFLRDIDIVEDREARGVVPDCATVPAALQRNCLRARAGWMGDAVALARSYRYGREGSLDITRARALFDLAARRGHPEAQWELALMLMRRDRDAPQDVPRSLVLLREAAQAGEAPAMNILGVAARDGTGQPRDDGEAARWFRQAAALRNPYGLANLARFYWQGRGGVPHDDREAVRLLVLAEPSDNPWVQIYLGEARETGRGTAQDRSGAVAAYTKARDQSIDPNASAVARSALERLGAKQ